VLVGDGVLVDVGAQVEAAGAEHVGGGDLRAQLGGARVDRGFDVGGLVLGGDLLGERDHARGQSSSESSAARTVCSSSALVGAQSSGSAIGPPSEVEPVFRNRTRSRP
jgi:hypothetical protein